MTEQESYAVEQMAAACEAAEKSGLTVIEATASQLFVDIDSKADLELFNKRATQLKEMKVAKSHRTTKSKSGCWHGFVELTRDMPVIERIALQALLGSDRLHEYLSYVSYLSGGESTKILFFEVPVKEAFA